MNFLSYLMKDIENENLPSKTEYLNKIKCELKQGKRVYWYFEEDLKHYAEENLRIKDFKKDLFSGIIVGWQDVENNWGELDFNDVVIVMDSYPIEMNYPQFTWFALKRLLDSENLIEIFSEDIPNGI